MSRLSHHARTFTAMFTSDDVPDSDPLPDFDFQMPAGLQELARTMGQLGDSISIEALTRGTDIEPFKLTVAPEVSILRDIRELQRIQSEAITEMAVGIKLLALNAQQEHRRTAALIALTVVIAVLTGALLVAAVG